MTETRTIPVFTYGTLRTGQHNERMLRPATVPDAAPLTATVSGFQLYSNKSRTYPYLVPGAPAESVVTGTLYLVDQDHPAFDRVRSMELGAGYDEEVVTATMPDGRTIEALAWTCRRTDWCGELIPSGDWCVWSDSNFPDWSGAFRR